MVGSWAAILLAWETQRPFVELLGDFLSTSLCYIHLPEGGKESQRERGARMILAQHLPVWTRSRASA